jgi:hypothetical protein
MLPHRYTHIIKADKLCNSAQLLDFKAQLHVAIPVEGQSYMLPCRYMHGTKADKLYDSTQLLDVKAQLDLGECGMQEVSFYHQHKNNVDFVFVDHPVYHRPGELVITACISQDRLC